MDADIERAVATLGDVAADILQDAVGTARRLRADDPWPSITYLTAVSRDLSYLAAAGGALARWAEILRDRAEAERCGHCDR